MLRPQQQLQLLSGASTNRIQRNGDNGIAFTRVSTAAPLHFCCILAINHASRDHEANVCFI